MLDPRLAGALRALRKASRMSGDTASQRMKWSPSKVSRMERCRTPVSLKELPKLLELYQVPLSEREQYIDFAQTAGQINKDTPMEARANVIRVWNPSAIPGPLRTQPYAEAAEHSRQPIQHTPPSKVQYALGHIQEMQDRLVTGRPRLHMQVVLGEGALGNGFGSKDVMAAQLQKLLDLATLPSVDLRIIRAGLSSGPRALAAFTVLSFPGLMNFATPDKVELIGVLPATLDEEIETWPHRIAFDLLQQAASPDDTEIVLKTHLTKWGG